MSLDPALYELASDGWARTFLDDLERSSLRPELVVKLSIPFVLKHCGRHLPADHLEAFFTVAAARRVFDEWKAERARGAR
jgi:hypothetical protein